MPRITKTQTYAAYGINFDGKKIEAPLFGKINPLLVNGNEKLGKGVWTWSTLPTTKEFAVADENGENVVTVSGTCPVSCPGCYATAGCYCFRSTKYSLAIKTVLARTELDFLVRAIIAQIKADKIRLLRIHCAGDFFSAEYIDAWKRIVKACPECVFWSYTKNPAAENAFDDCDNCNIVKSRINGIGFNFGKCGYIIKAYNALKAAGKNVYICRCGIDRNQHCTNCKGCSRNEYVLFVEHSTSYKAEEDPDFPELKSLIESQEYPA